MTKFVTPAAIPAAAWAALRSIGLPEGCTAATIRLKGDDPIEIECTFRALERDNEGAPLVEAIKSYRLVHSEQN